MAGLDRLSPTPWTLNDEICLTKAIAELANRHPFPYDELVKRLPWRSPLEVFQQFNMLIRSGIIQLPHWHSASFRKIASGTSSGGPYSNTTALESGNNVANYAPLACCRPPVPIYGHYYGMNGSPTTSTVNNVHEAESSQVIASTEPQPNNNGRWTQEEHRNFLRGLRKYQWGSWSLIAQEFVRTRSVTQIVSHSQKYQDIFYKRLLHPSRKKRRSIHDTTLQDEHGKEVQLPVPPPPTSQPKPAPAVGLPPSPPEDHALSQMPQIAEDHYLPQLPQIAEDHYLPQLPQINWSLPRVSRDAVLVQLDSIFPEPMLMEANEDQSDWVAAITFLETDEIETAACGGAAPFQPHNAVLKPISLEELDQEELRQWITELQQ